MHNTNLTHVHFLAVFVATQFAFAGGRIHLCFAVEPPELQHRVPVTRGYQLESIQDVIKRLRSSVTHHHIPKRLLAPRRPVQIEHIEGTDLLIIRGRSGKRRTGEILRAPQGPVQIEHLEGTDMLLLRGRGRKLE